MEFFFFNPSTIVTQVTPSSTDPVEIFSGVPIRVWGFTINITSGGGTAAATIRTNEASPTILWRGTLAGAAAALGRSKITVPIPFIADKGIEVISASPGNISFTFFHSQTGS